MSLLSPEKIALQEAADDPGAPHRQAERKRSNDQILELVKGQQVRKFCVEQSVAAANAVKFTNSDDIKKLTEFFYEFMTAEIDRS